MEHAPLRSVGTFTQVSYGQRAALPRRRRLEVDPRLNGGNGATRLNHFTAPKRIPEGGTCARSNLFGDLEFRGRERGKEGRGEKPEGDREEERGYESAARERELVPVCIMSQ